MKKISLMVLLLVFSGCVVKPVVIEKDVKGKEVETKELREVKNQAEDYSLSVNTTKQLPVKIVKEIEVFLKSSKINDENQTIEFLIKNLKPYCKFNSDFSEIFELMVKESPRLEFKFSEANGMFSGKKNKSINEVCENSNLLYRLVYIACFDKNQKYFSSESEREELIKNLEILEKLCLVD